MEMLNLKKGIFSDIIEYNGNYYYVDSRYTLDHGYETMVFACDDKGNVTDWIDLYCDIYATPTEMAVAHKKLIADLGAVL